MEYTYHPNFASAAAVVAAFRNSAFLASESFDSCWIVNAPVQFGLKSIKCTFRFHTSFVDAGENSETQVNGSTDHCVYTLRVSSFEDPKLLYSCRLDSKADDIPLRFKQSTPTIIKNMIEGANFTIGHPQFSMIHLIDLIGRQQEMSLFIRRFSVNGDGPPSLRLELHLPSPMEWKGHLLMFIENLQCDLFKERYQRELLEKDALSMKSQLAQLERRRGSLEKELEMAYSAMQQQQQQQSPVPSLNIQNDVESASPIVEEPTTSTIQLPADTEEIPKFNPFNLIQQWNSSSPSPASPGPLLPHKASLEIRKKRRGSRNKDALENDDLLIGVASLVSCAACPGEVTLRDQDGIKEHFINEHLDGEQNRCRACTEVVSDSDLDNHMKMHLTKEYACEFCGKKGRKHYLKSHIRIHTGEKPFECDQCPRRFADSSTYRRHQMVHTGEKKYSCPVCGRCIARKDNVRTHLKSHAKNMTDTEAAILMSSLDTWCIRTEKGATSASLQEDSPTSVENSEDHNLLGGFNLLESLKEDDDNSDKS